MDNVTRYQAGVGKFRQELDYLYKRLATVDNLIRSLQEYELHRPKPTQVTREKSA